MATELELKFSATPRALTAAARSRWLKNLSHGKCIKHKLVSVYFDSPGCKLHQQGVAWRIRTSGRTKLETIKAAANAAVFARGEWERETDRKTPDPAFIDETPVASLLGRKSRASLRPVFETSVERTTIPLSSGKSDIELAIDRGWIEANGSRERIGEIELELKHGDPADLAALAAELSGKVPLSYEPLAKADRGYALALNTHGKPFEAADIHVAREASIADAFQTIGFSCLRHAVANDMPVRNGDAEGIHQMRVGLRRLRAAMSVFKNMIESRETEEIKSGLKWLTERLAPARDFDVLLGKTLCPLEQTARERPQVSTLRADIEDRRNKGLATAKETLEGERYRELVLRTALWLMSGEWLRDEDPLRSARRVTPVLDFARDVLPERTNKIVNKLTKLSRLVPRQRHKLRIGVKKLRYSSEFFASLFPGSRKMRGRFAKILKSLQDALGDLNDMEVHRKLAHDFLQSGARKEEIFALGLVLGDENRNARSCIDAAQRAGRKLGRADRWWR